MRMHRALMVTSLGLVLLAASAFPGLAQPQPKSQARAKAKPPRTSMPMPMPMLMGAGRDTELTGMVQDIIALRAINSLGMSKDQIEKLIPVLQEVLAAEKRLREEALGQLRGERARLLAGTATPEQSDAARAAIVEARRRYADQVEQAKSRAAAFLSPEQMEKWTRLGAGAFTRRHAGARPMPGGQEVAEMLKDIGPEPSSRVLEHVTGLLKEKVKAM